MFSDRLLVVFVSVDATGTGLTKEMRAAAAKRDRRLAKERSKEQERWRKKRLASNLGEGMAGEWRPGIEHEGDDKAPVRKPLRAARLAARDKRRAKSGGPLSKVMGPLGAALGDALGRIM
jgi:hypothetical protein